MKRLIPFPLLSALFVALWLALEESVRPGTILFAVPIAIGAAAGLRVLEFRPTALRRPRMVLELAAVVLIDVVRSNIAVGRIVLGRGSQRRTSGFLRIPLDLRHPVGLAVLAAIITATPGTAWARYESAQSVLTIHILDFVDEATWLRIVKDRYERRLMEILHDA